MVFDDNEASRPLPDLLIDKLPAEELSAPPRSDPTYPIYIGVYK
jgi:hypothetical protein